MISGKYAGQIGTVEGNVYQRTVDYTDFPLILLTVPRVMANYSGKLE